MKAELFTALIDDAGIFPPGNLPLPAAVEAHAEHQRQWYGGLVGPFVCPDTQMAELDALLAEPLRVSVVATSGAEVKLPPLRHVEVVAVEQRALAADPAGRPTYVEGVAALDQLAAGGLRAKLRTGGASVPSEADVALFVLGCVERKVPFKCTAGLHHAVRHTAAEGEQHGFLNLLLATHAALGGAPYADVLALLAERDEHEVAHAVRGIDDAAAVRAQFTSFGSCSITEPVDDLVRLGLLVPGGTA